MRTHKGTLSNGLRIIFTNLPGAYSATASIAVGVGSLSESDKQAGLAHFLEHLLFRGTAKYPNARVINEAVGSVGGYNNASTSVNRTEYNIQVPAKHLPLALDILCDMVSAPLFDPVAVDNERGPVLEEMNRHRDDPAGVSVEAVESLLYPGHPLARHTLGSRKVIETVSPATVKAFWRRHYGAANMVVSVAGKVGHCTDVVNQIVENLGQLPAGKPIQPSLPVPPPSAERTSLFRAELLQAHMCVATRADLWEHADESALLALSTILGTGMSSRLFAKLREEEGLVYEIDTEVSLDATAGMLAVNLASGLDQAEQALEVLVAELGMTQPVTQVELDRAKELLLASSGYFYEDNELVAVELGCELVISGKIKTPAERAKKIKAVTVDDVQRLAASLLDPSNLRLGMSGPEPAIQELSEVFYRLVDA